MRSSLDFNNAAFLIFFTLAVQVADNEATVCPNVTGGTVVQYAPGKCVYVSRTAIDKRDDAKRECSRLGPQPNTWRLPKLDNADKNKQINQAVGTVVPREQHEWIMWLDLTRDDRDAETEGDTSSSWGDPSKWRWSDNITLADSGFTSWKPNEPNNNRDGIKERCVTSDERDGRWNDILCDTSVAPPRYLYGKVLIFVCEADAAITNTPTPQSPRPTAVAAESSYIASSTSCQKSESLLGAIVVGDICLVVLVCAVLLAGYSYWKRSRQNNADKSFLALSVASESH